LNNPNIDRITFDEPMTQLAKPGSSSSTTSLPTGPGFMYPELATMPYTGTGVGVAVIDSGSRFHTDLAIDFTGTVIGNADDVYGHGNHVAGIIGGHGSKGYYTGIAPGSSLISLKALNDDGFGNASDVIEALDWVLVNKDQYILSTIKNTRLCPQ